MVKRCFVISCILIVLVISPAYGKSGSYSSDGNKGTGNTVRVGKISDGDTMAVFVEGRFEKIRLLGMDAPEMGQRPWGRKAKACLKSFVKTSNSRVVLEYDIDRRDKYGRILAYVWTQDGRMINEEMLKKGCALLFTFPPNVKYAERFRAAQKKAQGNKAGIWGKNGLRKSPYDFRKERPRR